MPLLTTIAQIKDYLVGIGETVPVQHEDLLTFLGNAVSGDVEEICRRKFAQATYTAERHTGLLDQTLLWFYQWPVTSVTSVTLDGIIITEGTTANQYRQDKNVDGDVAALYRKDGWKSDPYGISLTYVAGYILPGVTGRTFPYPLERAVVELTVGEYLNRSKAGLTQQSFEGISETFDRLPLRIKDILGRHRRKVV